MKRNKTIGNLTFWIGLMMGFPFLYVLTRFFQAEIVGLSS